MATPGGGVEDAFLADVDGDGVADVVSCSESLPDAAVRVSWGADDGAAWDTSVLAASEGVAKWMFGVAADVDGDGDLDVVVGAQFFCPCFFLPPFFPTTARRVGSLAASRSRGSSSRTATRGTGARGHAT